MTTPHDATVDRSSDAGRRTRPATRPDVAPATRPDGAPSARPEPRRAADPEPRRAARTIPALAAVTALLLAVAGCTDAAAVTGTAARPSAAASASDGGSGDGTSGAGASTASPPTTPRGSGPSTPGTALAQLATLPVKGRAPATGYDRVGDFGPAWLDVDHNGCDTRDDVLARDLSDVVRRGPCTVVSGRLVSPYTGGAVAFVRGDRTSTLVQIDHVVALQNAWQSGAQALTPVQRESLANDPLNLRAVDGRSNEQKGSGDAATWLPASRAFRCTYVAHQIAVKARYALWVTPAEHDAMVRVLTACPQAGAAAAPAQVPDAAGEARPTPAPAVTLAPAPVPAPAPAPVPAPAASNAPAVVYANCDAVRAAGAAPLHAGDPGYTRTLDRDGDGTACEP